MLIEPDQILPDTTLAEFDPDLAPEIPEDKCPYLGLEAFHIEHQHLFFGRERLAHEFITKLQDLRLLAVVGPSGSGKSSLVLAGLIPLLQKGSIPGSAQWQYLPPMVPGSNPLDCLMRCILPQVAWSATHLKDFRNDAGHLARLVSEQSDQPVLLIVDQFEEIFTLCTEPTEPTARDAFVRNLLGLTQTAGARHTVILTMRSDFEEYVPRLPISHEQFAQAMVRVPPLDTKELREAIEKPAKGVGLRLADEIVKELVQAILGEPAGLPLMQFTLYQLWTHRERNRVSWHMYQQLGGGRRALAQRADAVYQELLPEDQHVARRILVRLVRLGQGLEVLRDRVSCATLYQLGIPRERIDRVLERLSKAQLLRQTKGETPTDTQVEVVHEALVRNWPLLTTWVEEERATLRRRQPLRDAATQWARDGEPSMLWRGRHLEDALEYRELSEIESAFIEASQTAERATRQAQEATHQREIAQANALAEEQKQRAEEERQRAEAETQARHAQEEARRHAEALLNEQKQRTKDQERTHKIVSRLAIGLAVCLVCAIAAGFKAWRTSIDAKRNARLANSRELAVAALSNATPFETKGMSLAMHAVAATAGEDHFVTPEAWGALHRTLQEWDPPRFTLAGHAAPITSVAFHPKAPLLVTGSEDRTVKVWNAKTGQPAYTLLGHNAVVNSVAFSPDGTYLISGGGDGAVFRWDLPDNWNDQDSRARIPRPVSILPNNPTGPITSVTFSPTGKFLAITAEDNIAQVWVMDMDPPTLLLPIQGHTALAFSPTNDRLATVSQDKKASIWGFHQGDEMLADTTFLPHMHLPEHGASITALAFSPKGEHLVTASDDGNVQEWHSHSGLSKGAPMPNEDKAKVMGIASSSDALRVFSMNTKTTVHNLSNHSSTALPFNTGSIRAIVAHPDGTRLAIISKDRMVWIWDTKTGAVYSTISLPVRVIGFNYQSEEISLATVSEPPQGMRVSADQPIPESMSSVRLWQVPLSDRKSLARPEDMAEPVDRRLECLQPSQEASNLHGGKGISRTAFAFMPNPYKIAIACSNKITKIAWVQVWDNQTERVINLNDLTKPVSSLAFDADGSRLATASEDGTALIWDMKNDTIAPLPLKGHTKPINMVTFSPNGSQLATASADATARLWDVTTGQLLKPLEGHTASVITAAFSPDGTLVATGSEDNTARVWDVATGQKRGKLAGHQAPVLAVAFSPQGTCPVTMTNTGTCLATASYDRTVALWNLDRVTEVFTLSVAGTGYTAPVTALAFGTDGRSLETVSADATVRSYSLDIVVLMNKARNYVKANPKEWKQEECKKYFHQEACPRLPEKP
jgi:WD40 repeat protein/energy-coupling factor transporter ATP-binding protein EcfA2